jgi:hypothetical protein
MQKKRKEQQYNRLNDAGVLKQTTQRQRKSATYRLWGRRLHRSDLARKWNRRSGNLYQSKVSVRMLDSLTLTASPLFSPLVRQELELEEIVEMRLHHKQSNLTGQMLRQAGQPIRWTHCMLMQSPCCHRTSNWTAELAQGLDEHAREQTRAHCHRRYKLRRRPSSPWPSKTWHAQRRERYHMHCRLMHCSVILLAGRRKNNWTASLGPQGEQKRRHVAPPIHLAGRRKNN